MKYQITSIAAVLLAMATLAVYAQTTGDNATEPPAPTPPTTQPASPITFTVSTLGLACAKPLPEDCPLIASELIPGTQAFFLLRASGGDIISLDKQATRLIAFADDTRTSLMPAGKSPDMDSYMWLERNDISGPVCMLSVYNSSKTPAKAARSIVIKADLIITCGRDMKTVRHIIDGTPIGKMLPAGKLQLKIVEGNTGVLASEQPFRLASKSKLIEVREVRFFDANGGKLTSRLASLGKKTTWQDDAPPAIEYVLTYALRKKAQIAAVEIDYYMKIDSVPVKLDVTVTPGL